jgi:hypothetical protein
MFKSFVVCCTLLAVVAALGAQPARHLPESDSREAQTPVAERESPDQRKTLRAALAAQKNAIGQPEKAPVVPRQLTPAERVQLREQLSHQVQQLR